MTYGIRQPRRPSPSTAFSTSGGYLTTECPLYLTLTLILTYVPRNRPRWENSGFSKCRITPPPPSPYSPLSSSISSPPP